MRLFPISLFIALSFFMLCANNQAQSASCGVGSFLLDGDGDGYPSFAALSNCPADCDDNNASVYPGAAEICGDGIDQNCDGVDTSCTFIDNDNDGFYSIATGGDDCDDNDPLVRPGMPEICGDTKDNDCLDGDLLCPPDHDADGYTPTSQGGNDCDDNDPHIHPHALEICGDNIDQDCAGGDAACAHDIDGDGFDNPELGGNDCDDFDASTYPGAPERCGDGRDQNCDGLDQECTQSNNDSTVNNTAATNNTSPTNQCDEVNGACGDALIDADNDGYQSIEMGGEDCNDDDAAIHPGILEICDDGIDQDCSGKDAQLDVDPICSDKSASNPIFAGTQQDGILLSGSKTEDIGGCRSLGTIDLWLYLLMLVSLRLLRRKKILC
jgi:hypothetical protein